MEHRHLHELKHRGFTRYDDIGTALKKLFATKLRKLESERVSLRNAANRTLSTSIVAERSLPPYNRSLVDGYALRSTDTRDSTRKNPSRLKILSTIKLGDIPNLQISRNECVHVLTGGYIPSGADAVVMFEHVEASKRQVKIPQPISKGANLVEAGSDVRKGKLLFKQGHILRWFELGLLAALNKSTIRAFKKPRVAVLSTGDELSEPGGTGTADSNRYVLLSAAQECGAYAIDLGIAKDDLKETLSALRRGLRSADMIVISGGSSVGKKDLVPEAVAALGKPGLVVHGIAMRPGSPSGLGAVNGKPILILPGLHVSALIGFYILGIPILEHLLGTEEPLSTIFTLRGRLMEDIQASKSMTSFRPVRVEMRGSDPLIHPIKPYGSSIVSSIAKADGIVEVGSNVGKLASGSVIVVHLLRPVP